MLFFLISLTTLVTTLCLIVPDEDGDKTNETAANHPCIKECDSLFIRDFLLGLLLGVLLVCCCLNNN